MKKWALQSVPGLTGPLFLVLGVSTMHCCLVWSGTVAMLSGVGWSGGHIVRKRHCFFTRVGEEFTGEGQSLPGSQFFTIVSKSGLSFFFFPFFLFAPLKLAFSPPVISTHLVANRRGCCFLTMQLIIFLENFYNFFWHLKNGVMSTYAGGFLWTV